MSEVIDYLLSLREGNSQLVKVDTYQVIINNVPALSSIKYTVFPMNAFAHIVYSIVFGESMVPHSLAARVYQGGGKLFDAMISGAFVNQPVRLLVFVTGSTPMEVEVTNYRLLVNYFEATTMHLSIRSEENYHTVLDALRRLHTSSKSEELLQEIADLSGGKK